MEHKSENWFVVQTNANKENIAVEHLNRQDFESWCPMLGKHVRQGRRMLTKHRALFPGYVFVKLDLQLHSWRSIDGTRGVAQLVKMGNRPARLPDEFVSRLLKITNKFGTVVFQEVLEPGDHVRVLSGSFDEWIGQVVALPDQERVTLLFDIVSRQIPVTLSRGAVVKVG